MAGLTSKSRSFIRCYESQRESYLNAAKNLEDLVRRIVREIGVHTHLVTARPKTVSSLRAKLLQKKYNAPDKQATDLLGVRVITYYDDEVDRVVSRLKEEFDIDPSDSIDKRTALSPREFGYRSVHLIASLSASRRRGLEYKDLAPFVFEIQVRSLLEHAWAEIEHEIVYKSAINYPDNDKRLIAALAGTLEMLDRQFRQLRELAPQIVASWHTAFKSGLHLSDRLDAARLCALLRLKFPSGMELPFSQARMSLIALSDIGITTARQLLQRTKGRLFRSEVRAYASTLSLDPSTVSHNVLILIVLALTEPDTIADYFPEFVDDPGVSSLIQRSSTRRRK